MNSKAFRFVITGVILLLTLSACGKTPTNETVLEFVTEDDMGKAFDEWASSSLEGTEE